MRINIHKTGTHLQLLPGEHRINILGGWGVDLGDFSVVLRDVKTQGEIKCAKTAWPIQSFALKTRAKQIFTINLPTEGTYEIVFINPQSIKVRRSNLWLISLFARPIPNEDLEIQIA